MKTKPAFPFSRTPDEESNNLANPYENNVIDASRGETYFPAPQSNSTMVSDIVEMTKRLKAFVPRSSVMEGRQPQNNLITPEEGREEDNIGANYKSFFQ